MRKVVGTESGGKSAYQASDGKYYDTTGRGHINERDANAHIDAEIQYKESQGINTITGIDGIICLIVCLILLGIGGYGLHLFSREQPLKGFFLVTLSVLPVYPLYRFFFYTFASTRKVVYLFTVAMMFLINWILTDLFDIHLLK